MGDGALVVGLTTVPVRAPVGSLHSTVSFS